MAIALKNLYNLEFYQNLSKILSKTLIKFNEKEFLSLIFDSNWQAKELKGRMYHTALVLNNFLDKDFKLAGTQIIQLVEHLKDSTLPEYYGLTFMFLPDYVEKYGIDDLETSSKVFEKITGFTSCEFAVRPFLIRYPEKMLNQMLQWSKDSDHHVRRLASEGSRPRLPWAIALPDFKKNPKPILPILENLKSDNSEYVRRSVANNLNDIAKDHPQIVIEIARKWKSKSKETDEIVKHACRSLFKQGNADILALYNLDSQFISSKNFKLNNSKIGIGDYLEFSFLIQNISSELKEVRLEYAIYFLLQNGKHYKKVFKISERKLESKETLIIDKKHSFKLISTRKYYTGMHKVSAIVNGEEKDILNFELT
jgi:3-methyladenine DNA glycosylase AlkC